MKLKTLIIVMVLTSLNMKVKGQISNHHYALNDYSIDSTSVRQVHLSTVTSDGGMIVLTGNEYRGSISLSNYGFSLIRFDANGNKLWNNFIYGEPNSNVNYKRIIELPDNGFAIIGNSNGISGGFLLKTDATGMFVFMKNYFSEILNCSFDPSDGGFLIVTNAGNTYSAIIKTDSTGAIVWRDTRNYLPDPDHYYTAKHLANGNYLTVGVAYQNPSLVYGNGLVACYSPTGVLLWSRGYISSEWVTSFRNFTELSDGTILIAGNLSTTNVSGTRTVITKIDSFGNVIWAKKTSMGLPISFFGYTFADNHLYAAGNNEVSGSSVVKPVIMKMDTMANLEWARIYPEPNWTADVYFGSSNDFSITGSILGFNNYRTFCKTDTALTQSCFTHDTTFVISAFTMTTVVTTPTVVTITITPTSLVRSNSSNENFVTFDACIFTGIEKHIENNSMLISIYPNPAKENITMRFSSADFSKGIKLTIINSLGQIIKTILVNTEFTTIELNNALTGIYFYKIYDRSGVLKTGKIIVD